MYGNIGRTRSMHKANKNAYIVWNWGNKIRDTAADQRAKKYMDIIWLNDVIQSAVNNRVSITLQTHQKQWFTIYLV
jgi:hypothetical protein